MSVSVNDGASGSDFKVTLHYNEFLVNAVNAHLEITVK